MNPRARITVLLGAAGLVLSTAALAAPPLPINPGLVDALTPAAPRGEPLSLAALEERVRETTAIAPVQKLALKAEVDALRARFRSAHAGGQPGLEALRDPYEKLMVKLQVMVRKDRQLARDISASTEPLWNVLTDRTHFAALN